MKKVLVCGAGGFIGSHLVKRLKKEGFWVRGVDLKLPDFSTTAADDFILANLCDQSKFAKIFDRKFDEVYQLAADMGGAGYIFTGENDANIMYNSALANLNVIKACVESKVGRVFYSSSACIYPEYRQLDPNHPDCKEESAYPAAPDSEYGWEKLFSERLYLSFQRNYQLPVRVARFHNIFGIEGTWTGGKEKAPAAICRKVAEAPNGGEIEIWGTGEQTRTFLYIDDCIEGLLRLMRSNFTGPVNIGSEEMVSINHLAKLVIKLSGKKLKIVNIDGPRGVMGRSSHNGLIKEKLGWAPSEPLLVGLKKTYLWISEQVAKAETKKKAA